MAAGAEVEVMCPHTPEGTKTRTTGHLLCPTYNRDINALDAAIRLERLVTDLIGFPNTEATQRLIRSALVTIENQTATEQDVQTLANYLLDRIGNEYA